MKTQQTLPIFCDYCNTLAVAEFEGAPLCIECLIREIDRQENMRQSFDEIRPLSMVTPPPEMMRNLYSGSDPVSETVDPGSSNVA